MSVKIINAEQPALLRFVTQPNIQMCCAPYNHMPNKTCMSVWQGVESIGPLKDKAGIALLIGPTVDYNMSRADHNASAEVPLSQTLRGCASLGSLQAMIVHIKPDL